MNIAEYQEHVYDKAMGVALRLATRRHYGFGPDDAPDIRSEVAARVLAKPYAPARAPGRAWAIMMIEQQVASYVAHRSKAKRSWRTPVVPLESITPRGTRPHDTLALDVRMALERVRPADREAAQAILDGRAESLRPDARRRLARIMVDLAGYVGRKR